MQHRVTFYHFRNAYYWEVQKKLKFLPKPKSPYILACCSCGWHSWMFKKIHLMVFFRRLFFCSWRGCNWELEDVVEVGPIVEHPDTGEMVSAIDEGLAEPEILGYQAQCRRCYRIHNTRSVDG